MSGDYIFIASGDKCALCSSLHGTYVDSAGYRPHANCTCNTVRRSDGATCEVVVEEEAVYERRGRPGEYAVTLSVTVICPNGAEASTQGMVSGDFGNIERNADIAEELARELCETACGGGDDDEFLCC